MHKVAVIGHYGDGQTCLDGQTVKTKIVTDELVRVFGEHEVLCFDTHGGKKTFLKAPLYTLKALRKSNNVIILPAHNGIRVFGRLLPFLKRFFKKRKIHYVVIGGWLPGFLLKHPRLARALKRFDGIYVETNTMKKALEEQGFDNVLVMPNCKKLNVIAEKELVYPEGSPYKLCTFSRVMKKKGIEDAVISVKAVNESLGYTAYTLDIYGPVDQNQIEWFDNLKASFPNYITYCGCVDADKSTKVLKNYFALLFPTRFYTEGIPGTIIDAYAAGVPVISARWESFDDIISEHITGIGYEFEDVSDLKNALLAIEKDSNILVSMKINCLESSNAFIPESVVQILTNKLKM